MVVTFETPIAGEGFAIGYLVQPVSDLVGPIPNDSFWIIAIQHLEDGSAFVGQDNIMSPTTTPPPKIFGEREDGRFFFPFPHEKIAIGDDVRLLAELRSNTLGTQDTGSIVVKWRPQEAVPWVQQQNALMGVGGFSDADRLALMRVNAWVWLDLVEEFLPEITDWIGDRIRSKPIRRLIDPDRALEGEVLPPALTPFFGWVGLAWELVERPTGWGIDEGNPDLTEIDYMQVVPMRETEDGGFVALDGFYTRQLEQSIIWGSSVPSKVQYFVMPGGLVRFYHLLQLLPAARRPAG